MPDEVTGDVVGDNGESILNDETPDETVPDTGQTDIPLPPGTETDEVDDIPTDTPNEVPDETPTKEEETPEEKEPEVELSPRDKALTAKITEKYPNALKEFPEIRSALYEQKEFRKLYPSVDDAKEALERSEVLDILEEGVLAGESEPLLAQIAEIDPKAHEKFVSNFLPTLHKQNPALYDKVLTPLFKNALFTAFQHGKKTNNPNLERAAKHLSLFLFETPEVTPGEVEKEDPKLAEERTKFHEERQNTFRSDVQKNSVAVMTSRIEKMIPKEVEPTLKKIVVDSVLKGIGAQLNKDEYYRRQVDSLFRKAAKASYAGDWGPRIQGVYLGHATKLLPAVYGLISKEILGNRANPKTVAKPTKTTTSTSTTTNTKDTKDPWKPDPKTGKKMTDVEFLAS